MKDALALDNPQHYRKVREIMAEVEKKTDSRVPLWKRMRFHAEQLNGTYSGFDGPSAPMASIPDKRNS